MSVRYGKEDCKHFWVYREDGWEEGCVPAICRKCGSFGCLCDVNPRPSKKVFFGKKAKSTDNIGGAWKNPYVIMSSLKKYEELKKLCEGYDGSKEQFTQIVSRYVEIDEERHKLQLANGFGVSIPTISRWISGRNTPRSFICPQLIRYILRRAKYKIRILANATAIAKEE